MPKALRASKKLNSSSLKKLIDSDRVGTKLQETILKRMANLEVLKENRDAEIEAKCTFAPSLTNKSRQICTKIKFKPIEKRYKDIQKGKEKKIVEARAQIAQQEQEVILQNKLNNAGKKPRADFYEKQMFWAKARRDEMLKRKVEMVEFGLEEEDRSMVVKSQHLKFSKKIEESFFERQEQYKEIATHNLVNISLKMDKELSFKPTVNPSSRKLLSYSIGECFENRHIDKCCRNPSVAPTEKFNQVTESYYIATTRARSKSGSKRASLRRKKSPKSMTKRKVSLSKGQRTSQRDGAISRIVANLNDSYKASTLRDADTEKTKGRTFRKEVEVFHVTPEREVSRNLKISGRWRSEIEALLQ